MRGTENVEKIGEILNWKYGFETLLDLYRDKNWDNSLIIAKNEDGFITLADYVVDFAIKTVENKKEGIFIFDMNSKQKIDNAYELLGFTNLREVNIQNLKIVVLGKISIEKNKNIIFSDVNKIMRI